MCTCGDSALYPLCNVRIELEGRYIQVVAAVSDTLPTSVLLGTDVVKWVNEDSSEDHFPR